MGFYSPQSLIQDARRHGISILPVDVNASGKEARVVPVEGSASGFGIRVGLNLVKGLGGKAAERVEAASASAAFVDISDLARRADLNVEQVEALATAGALDCFGVDRRQALWQAGVAATERTGMLPGLSAIEAPSLPGMSAFELMATDIAATGVTADHQPMDFVRANLELRGVLTARDLKRVEDGSRVRIAGIVTHRQRPQTASGVTFFGLEDETGLLNVMVTPGLWARHKTLARTARALVVRGIVQNASGAVTVAADKLEPLELSEWLSRGSRDFR